MINQNKVQIRQLSGFTGFNKTIYELLIDGYIVDGVTVGENYKDALGLPNYYVISEQIDSLQEITALTLNEFSLARVENVLLINWTKWEGFNISVTFGRDHKTRKKITFEVEFVPDAANWKYPYSYNDYYTRFHQICETEFDDDVIFGVGGITTKFSVVVTPLLNDLSIAEEIEKNLGRFLGIHEKTLSQLKDEQFENALLASFSFPEELKIPCKQYLLYFAQFLQDLGINATSNLKEKAGKVLFSVTPTGDIEALDKIREALAVYLNLPSSPVLYNDSFQSMQLKQQVENLQHSQRMKEMEMRSAQYALRLAQQNIENQDKMITQQNSFIDNQNKIIEKITSKSIMIDSLENKEELEKFCEGFEVGKSEFLIKHFGLHLNPATVLKNVGKKILGKQEKISILDSDEEIDKK
ncbi:MAG TPA: hypothetical protein VF721_08360 [Pyrinomonadaceae bacterium]|jgi:hypothetical protein